MDTTDLLRPARRFLHVCYCCADADETTRFFVDNLGMKASMRSPLERTSGELLGLEEMEGYASFVYDYRGGRVSPAIEIQTWVDPALEGVPSVDPFEAGMKSLGFSVSDLDGVLAKLGSTDSKVIARGEPSPWGDRWTTVLDPNGVILELVEDSSAADGAAQLRHLRITVTNLEVSIPFYESIGFALLDNVDLDGAAFLGHGESASGRAARMRLPDEPFQILLVQWTDPQTHGRHYEHPYHAGLFRTAMHVYDTFGSMDAMSAEGFVFDRGPLHTVINDGKLDMWLGYFSDPEGILHEFVQRPASAFKRD